MNNHNTELTASLAVSNTLVRKPVLLPQPSQSLDQAIAVKGNLEYPLKFDQVLELSKTFTFTPLHSDNIAFLNNITPPQVETLPAVIEALGEYQKLRETAGRLTNFSKAEDSSFISEVEKFIKLDVSTSTEADIATGKRLIKKSYSVVNAIETQAIHVTTFHKVQVGKVAHVLQGLVKKHKLGNWKTEFSKYFKDISYETVNNWKNVSLIPRIEDWIILDIWKLVKLRSAYIALGIKTNDPLKDLSALLGINFTEDITEKQLKILIDREKFKKSLTDNSIDLDHSIVDDLATINEVKLNDNLLKKFKDIQEAGGDPKEKAKKLMANKGKEAPTLKSQVLPDQLSFDEQAGPLLKMFDLLLKTPPEEVNLEFKLLDQLIKKSIEIDRHFSRNIFHKQA